MKSSSPLHHPQRLLMAMLILALMLATSAVNAQDDRPQDYLVELIVFSHTSGQPDGYRTTELEDFSERLDPLQLAQAERAAIEAEAEFRRLSANPEAVDAETIEPETLPEPYLALPELSEPMQQALNRLNRSDRHEVLTSRAWLQTAERRQRTRWLRLHDEQIIDWTGGVEIETTLPDLEEPVMHYQLDGQTRLRRTQFLNLALELEWRQAAGRPAPILRPGSSLDDDEIQLESIEQPQAWRVHRFEQARAVRIDRLEYFDSEWLGVVALITEIEPPEPPAEPEPEPPAEETSVETDAQSAG